MQTVEEKQNKQIADFWQAAGDFYQKSAVKKLLLGLQDKDHYSVNRLLFALWFSQTFQKLIEIAQLETSSKALLLTEQSTTELRCTRRTFEQHWKKPYLGNLNMARYHMLEGELSLEKEIQSILVVALCRDKTAIETKLSAESLDFLIVENIEILCQDSSKTSGSTSNNSAIQQLSMLWIQHQDCYN